MASNTRSRTPARQELARVLEAALVGSGKPVSILYRYLTRRGMDVDKASPVLIVTGDGSSRQKSGMGSTPKNNNSFFIDIHVALRPPEGTWTEELIEDTFDILDKAIADVIGDNRINSNWLDLELTEDRSEKAVDPETGYIIEVRTVEVFVVDT